MTSRKGAGPAKAAKAKLAKPAKASRPAKPAKPAKASKTAKAARRPARRAGHADPAVIYARLLEAYPDAHCELDFGDPFQLLVATILSAQCTDRRVNMVTPSLFAAFPDAAALSAAPTDELEEIIRSTGFFRSKAKNLIGMATALVEQHDGRVPPELDALVQLPGVGRKTANVILGNAFDRNDGVVVDTHVQRVSARLGLTHGTDPVKIEQELMQQFPRDQWTMLSHLLIFHGRRICDARRPRCGDCPLLDLCPSGPVFLAGGA